MRSTLAGRSLLCPRESLLEVLWGLDVRIPFWMPESMSEPRFGCRNPNGNKMRRNTETQLRKSLRRNLRNKTQGRRIPRNRTKKDIRKERSEDPICLVSRASLHSSDCLSRHETTQGAIEGRQRRGENTIHTEKVSPPTIPFCVLVLMAFAFPGSSS